MMRSSISRQLAAVTALACVVAGQASHAQHLDVLTQVVDGKIVTGAANYDNNTWIVGQTVFERQFLSNFRTNDPGFTALETGNPLLESGVIGFAPQTDLFLDIVPTTIGGQRANFWYWDGVDVAQDGYAIDDVDFGFAPVGITWNVFDDDFELLTADGSDTVVPNALVQTAFSDGGIHQHLLMQVADSDGNTQTTPPQGIYLAAMVLHAEGYEASEPFFFVNRTAGLTNEPRDVAADWVRMNYEILIREPLPADFNGDGQVDGDDFLIWQANFMTTTNATRMTGDANGDGAVDGDDFLIWQAGFGASLPGEVRGVPEPSSLAIAVAGLVLVASRRR